MQLFKTFRAFLCIACVAMATLLFVSCNEAAPTTESATDAKTDTPMTVTPATPDTIKSVADSLPAIDPSASTRPETRKAH